MEAKLLEPGGGGPVEEDICRGQILKGDVLSSRDDEVPRQDPDTEELLEGGQRQRDPLDPLLESITEGSIDDKRPSLGVSHQGLGEDEIDQSKLDLHSRDDSMIRIQKVVVPWAKPGESSESRAISGPDFRRRDSHHFISRSLQQPISLGIQLCLCWSLVLFSIDLDCEPSGPQPWVQDDEIDPPVFGGRDSIRQGVERHLAVQISHDAWTEEARGKCAEEPLLFCGPVGRGPVDRRRRPIQGPGCDHEERSLEICRNRRGLPAAEDSLCDVKCALQGIIRHHAL
ncbi:MAG: hypothetical protein ABIK09_11620 [Pseudomonadota bacterium]